MNSKRAATTTTTTTLAEAAAAAATATPAETVSVVLCARVCVCALSLLGLLLLLLCCCCSPSHLDGSPQSVRSMCFSAAARATSTAAVVLLRAAARVDVCVCMCVCVACVPFNRCRSSGMCVCVLCGTCGMWHVSVSLSVCRCFDCVSLPRRASPHLAFHSCIHSLRSREAANKKQQQKKYNNNKSFCMRFKESERGERERVCVCGQSVEENREERLLDNGSHWSSLSHTRITQKFI